MAAPIGYQQFCPMGAALNVIGERWALMIVRDLMLGPRRYSELAAGLGGIGTDILAARLRSLQDQAIVHRTGDGRNQHYELTAAGQELRAVMIELSRWGAGRAEFPADPSQIPPRVPLTSLLVGAPELPRELDGVYDVRLADESVHIEVNDGKTYPAPAGAAAAAGITLTWPGLLRLISGPTLPASQLVDSGVVTIDGDENRALALLDALSRPRP